MAERAAVRAVIEGVKPLQETHEVEEEIKVRFHQENTHCSAWCQLVARFVV